uniref:Uncharacterized protein n=1 Tax=Anguilla anguilla TaxID=7936 RepID=A0A0E9RDZ7_ANGAN
MCICAHFKTCPVVTSSAKQQNQRWETQVQVVKVLPDYFVPITWICKLAQFFNQEAELIGEISWLSL